MEDLNKKFSKGGVIPRTEKDGNAFLKALNEVGNVTKDYMPTKLPQEFKDLYMNESESIDPKVEEHILKEHKRKNSKIVFSSTPRSIDNNIFKKYLDANGMPELGKKDSADWILPCHRGINKCNENIIKAISPKIHEHSCCVLHIIKNPEYNFCPICGKSIKKEHV